MSDSDVYLSCQPRVIPRSPDGDNNWSNACSRFASYDWSCPVAVILMDDEVVFNGETTLLGKRGTNPPLILDDPDHHQHHLPPHMGQLRPPTSNGTIHRAGPGRAVFKWFTVIIGNFCWKDFPLNFHFKFKLSKINFAMPFTKMSNFEIYSKWFKSLKHRQLKVESFCNIELIRIYFHAGLENERCLSSGGCES